MTRTRILIADDDPVLTAIGAESLASEGYEVATADDGSEALEILRRDEFDLVILDIQMPEMNGLAALREVRAAPQEELNTVPVIMLTGLNDDDAIRACYDSGATSYIAKPVNWLNMTHQIAFILRAEANARGLRMAHARTLELSQAKDTAMMTLRHELRSPLHIIKGFSTLLSRKLAPRLEADEANALSMIDEAVESMTEKMRRLFLYADLLSGDAPLTADFSTGRRVVNRAVEAVDQAAAERGIQIEASALEGTPVELKADEEKLVTALIELLDNAVKFAPEGSTVRVRWERRQNGAVSFIVEDDGGPLEETQIKGLFGAFVQGDSGLTRSSTGVGIGLTVARAIARAHGGSVRLGNGGEGGIVAELVVADGLVGMSAVA